MVQERERLAYVVGAGDHSHDRLGHEEVHGVAYVLQCYYSH